MRSRKPPKAKTLSITEQIRAKDEEQRLRDKAYEIWEKRGKTGTLEENWDAAIKALKWQRLLQPFSNFWHWTGIQEKKGWDFLQLLVAPLVLAVIGLGLQEYVKEHDQQVAAAKVQQDKKLADDKAQQDRQLADDKAKQDTLVKYLDQMADSLQHGLLKAKPGDDQFIVAQSRTVLALQSLDKQRQHLVIQFLSASGLNDQPDDNWQPFNKQRQPNPLPAKTRVLLYQAQLSKANLVNSDLSGAALIGVNLLSANFGCKTPESQDSEQCSVLNLADLRGADLIFANLSRADLSQSNLSRARLARANLSRAYFFGTNFDGAKLQGANLSGAYFDRADLKGTNFDRADLGGAVLLSIDLRQAKFFTPQQLEGKEPPLLCNVALPEGFKDKDKLKDRDCDRLPKELLKRYPQFFRDIEAAKKVVDEARRKKWN